MEGAWGSQIIIIIYSSCILMGLLMTFKFLETLFQKYDVLHPLLLSILLTNYY